MKEVLSFVVGITAGIFLTAVIGLTMFYERAPELEIEITHYLPPLKPVPTETGGAEADIVLEEYSTFVFPIAEEDWKVTSPWGIRISPIYDVLRKHLGLDISVKHAYTKLMAPQVVAVADGYILHHWINHPTKGKYIVVQHEWGRTHYSHCRETFVHEYRDGKRWQVKAGETIARMGDTGAADGAHLHFEIEILVDGQYKKVDPALYLEQVLPDWEEHGYGREAE